jgi:hypothetical protein
MTIMGGMAVRLPVLAKKGVVVPVQLHLYWIRHTTTGTLGAGDMQIAARDQQACTQGVKHQPKLMGRHDITSFVGTMLPSD